MWLETLFRKTPALPAQLPDNVKRYFLQQLPHKHTPISDLRFVVFDTETTGLEEKKGDRLLSIGAIGMKGYRVDLNDTFYAVVNPDNHCAPAETVKVHFITPSETIAAPSVEEVLPKFLEFIKADVLVAHHALFDIGFIGSEMKRLTASRSSTTSLIRLNWRTQLIPPNNLRNTYCSIRTEWKSMN